jgi:hypothetical protein
MLLSLVGPQPYRVLAELTNLYANKSQTTFTHITADAENTLCCYERIPNKYIKSLHLCNEFFSGNRVTLKSLFPVQGI